MTGINRLSGAGIYNQNNYTKKRVVSTPVHTDYTPQKVSNKKNWAIAAGIATAVLTGGAILLTKGKALRQKRLLAEIPTDLQARFANIKDLKGKEFVDKAYKEMVDYMGLSKVAPKEITINADDKVFAITGGYNPIKNTIGYSKGFLTKLAKEQQLNMLSHELKHCEQFTNMLRTEGITVEQYAAASVDTIINDAISGKSLNNLSFQFLYEAAKKQGKAEEFLKKVKADAVESRVKTIKENFADVLALPKIKADSPEGKKAYEHLKAYSNYEGIGFLGTAGEAYKNNPLEREAYSYGDKIEEMLKKYTRAMA